MQVTKEVVDFFFKELEEGGMKAVGELPAKLACARCNGTVMIWTSLLGANRIVCQRFECPMQYDWPMGLPAVLADLKLEPTTPVHYVPLLVWDYTTKPAHSRFVQAISGPEFEAEVKRNRDWAFAELRRRMR